MDIAGATSATFTIAAIAEADAGEYQCVVTNVNGTVTSSAALLTTIDLSDPLKHSYTIVDTGQRKFYDDSTTIAQPAEGADHYGQDGQYIGNQPTYVTSADGKSVYDYHTGLTWTQTPDLNGDGTIDVNDKKLQGDAAAYVATLNAANFGGYNDWRLPSIKEIYSLMDFRGTDPTSDDQSTLVPFIDTDYFDFGYGDTGATPAERTIDAQFATTSIYVDTVMGGQTAMFGLNLADGRIKGYPLTADFYVLYVRGNTDYGVNDFVDNSDNTVTDNATGLMWQQDDSGSGMLWKEALAYAEASTHAGYGDWRLPNAKELHSLLDYTRSPATTSSPAIDAIFTSTQITNEGGEVDYPWYYTGTTHAQQGGGATYAVYLCFGRGTGYFNSAWQDVHGAGSQRSELKVFNTTGYTQEGAFGGYYFTQSPQGDSARFYNYVRLVRDVPEVIVNVAPTLSLSGDSAEVSGDPVSNLNFASASGLAAGESVLGYTVTVDDSSLFSVQPAIDINGTLTYTGWSKVYGVATVTVTVQDDGSTDNGGVDTSDEMIFTITVRPDYFVIQAAFDPNRYASLGDLALLSTDTIVIDTDAGTITGAVTLSSDIVETDLSDEDYRIFCFDSVDIPAGATVTITGSLPIAIISRGDFTLAGDLSVSGADGGDTSGSFPVDLVVEGAGGAGGDGGLITLAAPDFAITGSFDVSGGDAGDSGAANGAVPGPGGADGGTAGNTYALYTGDINLTVNRSHGDGGSGVPDGMSGLPDGPEGDDYGQEYYLNTPSYLGVVLYYVDVSTPASAATQDGLSWTTAFADLQDALACAVADDEIWIAAGVYYPDEAEAAAESYASVTAGSSSSSFRLIEGVSIYGGFDGSETARSQRDWVANVTILSGDLDKNDTKVNDVVVISPETNTTGTNAKIVVIGVSNLDTILDGVTITAGSGNAGAGGVYGGGTFRRCVIQGNYSSSETGGISSFGSLFTLTECDILANTGNILGGVGAYNLDGFEMTSCRVQGNTATTTSSSVGCGGIDLGQGGARLTNCLVTGNVGYRNGGIGMRGSGRLSIFNSTIAGNYAYETATAETTGGLGVDLGATCSVYNTIIWANESPKNDNIYGITYRENALFEGELATGSGSLDGHPGNDPQFLSFINASATATTAGDFRLNGAATAVGAGDDFSLEDDKADLDEDGDVDEVLPYDLDGNARVIDTMDIGAYEYVGPTLVDLGTVALSLDENVLDYVDLIDLDTFFIESGLSYAVESASPSSLMNTQITGSVFASQPDSAAGVSVEISFTATDAEGNQNTTSFTVSIVSAVEAFRSTYGLASDGSEDSADASGNGVANILYFAFNLGDPSGTEFSYADVATGTMGLPVFEATGAADTWTFTYVRRVSTSDATYEAQYSTDLSTWSGATSLDSELQSTTVTAIDSDYEFVTLEFELSSGAFFFRVAVDDGK